MKENLLIENQPKISRTCIITANKIALRKEHLNCLEKSLEDKKGED